MSKTYPLFLYQYFKAFNSPVETVQHQHGQGCQLSSPVPSVTAVHKHWALPWRNFVCNLNGSCQNKLQRKICRSEAVSSREQQGALVLFQCQSAIHLHSSPSPDFKGQCASQTRTSGTTGSWGALCAVYRDHIQMLWDSFQCSSPLHEQVISYSMNNYLSILQLKEIW